MKEYSCRVFNAQLSLFEKAGFDLTPVFEPYAFDREFVKNPRNWVDWNDACELLDAIGELVGGRERYLEIVREGFGKTPHFNFMRGVIRLVVDPANFFKSGNMAMMKRGLPIAEVSWEQLSDGRIVNRCSIPEHYRGSELFFDATVAVISILPTLIGCPAAEVEADTGPHQMTCIIRPPANVTLAHRLYISWLCIFNQKRIFEDLEGQAYALSDKQLNINQLNSELKTMVEDAVYPVVLLEAGVVIRFSNRAFQQLLGVDADSLNGQMFRNQQEIPAPELPDSWFSNKGNNEEPLLLRFLNKRDNCSVRAYAHCRPNVMFGGRQMTMVTLRDVSREQELEKELLAADQKHRDAIAKELHDDLGQQLTAMSLMFGGLLGRIDDEKTLSDLKQIENVLTQSRETARSVTRGLQPVSPSTGGLFGALRGLVDQIRGVDDSLEIIADLDSEINPDLFPSNQLFRIAQESLNNAIKHSGARRISIILEQGEHVRELCIQDDGKGFDLNRGGFGGFGLENMKRRSLAADLEWSIETSPGTGCCVRCRF